MTAIRISFFKASMVLSRRLVFPAPGELIRLITKIPFSSKRA
jgi:hypothetical protein